MILQHIAVAGGAAVDEGFDVLPDVVAERGEFGPRQKIALQAVELVGIDRLLFELVDELQQDAVELVAERMLRIAADFFEKLRC